MFNAQNLNDYTGKPYDVAGSSPLRNLSLSLDENSMDEDTSPVAILDATHNGQPVRLEFVYAQGVLCFESENMPRDAWYGVANHNKVLSAVTTFLEGCIMQQRATQLMLAAKEDLWEEAGWPFDDIADMSAQAD